MGATHQLLKFLHTLLHIDSQVGVHVVVVGDGIGRASPTLHNSRMLTGNAILRVVGHRGVTNDASVPHMRDTHLTNLLQHLRREAIQFATAVLFNGTKRFTRLTAVAIQTRKNLVNNDFRTFHYTYSLFTIHSTLLCHERSLPY